MYVYVYVYIHIYMCICMYIYVCIYMYVYIYLCTTGIKILIFYEQNFMAHSGVDIKAILQFKILHKCYISHYTLRDFFFSNMSMAACFGQCS